MKLGLGTVQFGLNYGVSNKDGITGLDQASEILTIADQNNIHVIDTASQYGTSEETLGKIFPQKHDFKIVTKTPSYTSRIKRPITMDDSENLEQVFLNSLKKLNSGSVYGLMAHHCDDLLEEGGDLLFAKMMDLKKEGLTKKIGVSVYSPEQALHILNKYKIDLIQIPLNIFDQRFLENDLLKKLKKDNIEIHARSAFLQGLLLMTERELPLYFNPIKDHFANYQKYLSSINLTSLEAALGFVLSIDEVDNAIVGVNNTEQFLELLKINAFNQPLDFSGYRLDDLSFINPANWKIS